jgi:hypothetical protein
MSSETLTGEAARQYIENLKAQGVPVMKPHHDPRLLTMTPEEQAAYLVEFMENGPPPEGPVRSDDPPVAPAPAAGGGFRPGTLALPGRSERYTLPNGQTLWVHPCSTEEAIALNVKAIEETQKSHNGQLRTEADWQEISVQLEQKLRGNVHQAIFACRTGPEPTSARFFGPEHADELRREPGYFDSIREIAAISDALMAGQGEAAALKEALARFFAFLGEKWAPTWCSLLKEGSSPMLTEALSGALTDFGRSASALSQPNALSVGTLAVMHWQLQEQTPSSAPSGESEGTPLTVVAGGEE